MSTKVIFWISVALLITLIDPDTLVKIMAVLWVLFVAYWGGVRVLFGVAWRKGAVTVKICGHRAHSIHCHTMRFSSGDPSEGIVDLQCNCTPSHPADCGHCK